MWKTITLRLMILVAKPTAEHTSSHGLSHFGVRAFCHQGLQLMSRLSACALLGLGLSACQPNITASEPLRFSGGTMGTSYTVLVYAPESARLRLDAGIQATLSRVVQATSVYEPRSNVSRFNAAAPEHWVALSDDLYRVMTVALAVAERTEGAFEPTLLPLVNLWGFGPRGRVEEVPAAEALAAARADTGWQALELRAEPPALRKMAPREVDLGGIAKGYGADAVAEYLRAQGYSHFLVDLGGDLVAQGGKPDGSLWRVGIEQPIASERRVFTVIELSTAAMVTSGDYRNFFEVDGVRYSHTLDPRTGYPIAHGLASVSVLAETGLEADAWATALMVLGSEAALAMAHAQELSVLLIERSDDGFVSHRSGTFLEIMGE